MINVKLEGQEKIENISKKELMEVVNKVEKRAYKNEEMEIIVIEVGW